jgi:hypothetical protein
LRLAALFIMLPPMPKCLVSLQFLIATLTIAAALAPADGRSDDTDVHPFTFDNWLLAPVRVHLLSASNAPAIHTTLAETDVTRILKKMNGVWSQAGLTFWLESVVREEATNQDYATKMGQADDLRGLLTLRPVLSRATNCFHIYYVNQFSVNGVYLGPAMFVKQRASLRAIPGGIDEPLPRVSSHELGHALTLPHHTNDSHLMARGTTGTNLGIAEIQKARDAAAQLPWIERAPEVLKRADVLEGKSAEAHALYTRIATMPLEDGRVLRARKR